MLTHALDVYLRVRRAAGFDLGMPEVLLRSFVRFAQERGEVHVQTQTAITWAALAPSPGQREHRLQTVVRFARSARAEDARHEVPPRGMFGHHRQRHVPFIFTPAEISRLIQAASQLGPAGSLRPHVYSTLFALLAATGLRISEALRLRLADVTPDGLLIQHTKFQKSRLVPLHDTATAALDRYLERRRREGGGDDHVFISLRGQRLPYCLVYDTFRALLDTIRLHPSSGRPRPRLHDLRHTFAVRSLEACPDGRDRIGQHMLALSTYLGHTHVADTFWYLESTPQLTADIANACEHFVKGETS